MAMKDRREFQEPLERNYRIHEFARIVGYKESTVRRKLYEREISYKRVGRILVIPESEARRLLSNEFPMIEKK